MLHEILFQGLKDMRSETLLPVLGFLLAAVAVQLQR